MRTAHPTIGANVLLGALQNKRELQVLFFPQVKVHDSWVYCLPVRIPYGYRTIEECESWIVSMEESENRIGGQVSLYRIKEEVV